jgi:hypothetical protein
MRDEIRQVREFSRLARQAAGLLRGGHDPLISGIRWVSEIVEIAGGRDIFRS